MAKKPELKPDAAKAVVSLARRGALKKMALYTAYTAPAMLALMESTKAFARPTLT